MLAKISKTMIKITPLVSSVVFYLLHCLNQQTIIIVNTIKTSLLEVITVKICLEDLKYNKTAKTRKSAILERLRLLNMRSVKEEYPLTRMWELEMHVNL
jgi:hypothetical protein